MCGGFVGFGLGVLVRALFESGFDGSQVLDGSTGFSTSTGNGMLI